MASPKLTGFLISLVLVITFASMFGIVTTKFAVNYGQNYNTSTFDKYTRHQANITKNLQDIRDKTQVNAQRSGFDIIGSYFSAGFSALKIAGQSFGVFNAMAEDITGDVNMDDGGLLNILKTSLVSIMLILLFVGIFIAIIVKKDDL